MSISHKAKVKIARKLAQGGFGRFLKIPGIGIFTTPYWEVRKQAIASRVARKQGKTNE